MSGKICQGGLLELFNSKLGAFTSSWRIRLFTNNHTPDVADVLSTYTEASYSGYAAQGLGTTPTPTWDSTNKQYIATWAAIVFVGNGGGTNQSCYGYMITDATPALVWAELFSAGPYLMGPTANSLSITLNLQDINQF